MPLYRPAIIKGRGVELLYRLLTANMNTTADQVFEKLHSYDFFIIQSLRASNASGDLTTAVGGIYTATGKGGSQLVGSGYAWSTLSSATVGANLTATSLAQARRTGSENLYLSLTTPKGVAATADILVWGSKG